MATINSRYTMTLGTFKLEVLDLDEVNHNDTFVTVLQDPRYMVNLLRTEAPNARATSKSGLSGNREITITNALLNDNSLIVLVFGY